MDSARRFLALTSAFVAWLWSGAALLAGITWGIALRCDDACDGDGWRRGRDGWQWDGVVALGVVAFLGGTALLVFVWRGKRMLAAAGFLVGLGAVLGLASALSPSWHEHLGRLEQGEAFLLFLGFAAPIVAVLLAERRVFSD